MATRSALINVMHKAATAASRNMLRDFGEVENLQVSRKGPADFVSRVDTNAERIIKAELSKARPAECAFPDVARWASLFSPPAFHL